MRRRISPRCLILLGIILGVCSLTHTSSSAQGTSASRDKEEFAKRMGSHLQLLKECEDSESRVEKNQKELEKAYQVVYEKCDALRKYHGKASEAWREYEVASYARREAEDKYRELEAQYNLMLESCRTLMRATNSDWAEIRECVDTQSFYEKVLEPFYNQVLEPRRRRAKEADERQLEEGRKESEAQRPLIAACSRAEQAYYEEMSKYVAPIMVYHYRVWAEEHAFSDGYLFGDGPSLPYMRDAGRPLPIGNPYVVRDVINRSCKKVRATTQEHVKRASEITHLLAQDCRFGEADQFVGSLPDPLGYDVKSELARHVAAAKKREDDAATKYRQANDLYRKGQVEERAGKLSEAGGLYRNAITRLQEGRTVTKCPSKPELFDKAVEKTNLALARLAGQASAAPREGKRQTASCAVPQDCAAQKRALRASIKIGNTFRKDGGGQWNPTIVKRASDSVGSEELPATPLELNAMNNLIGGYEGCYANYWAFYEGELPQLTRARDDAYQRRDPATGQRLNEEIGKRKADMSRTHNDCIYHNDETWKTAIRRAKEACK